VFAVELFPRLFVFFVFIVHDVAHNGVKGLFRAVRFDLFDGCVKNGVFEFFGEAITKAAFIG
jgi:hypothetical protein